MTDKERIDIIKLSLEDILPQYAPQQIVMMLKDNIRWLLGYIEDMELPVSTGKRQIEKLELEVAHQKSNVDRCNEINAEILAANRSLRAKYEPDDYESDNMHIDLLKEALEAKGELVDLLKDKVDILESEVEDLRLNR